MTANRITDLSSNAPDWISLSTVIRQGSIACQHGLYPLRLTPRSVGTKAVFCEEGVMDIPARLS
jgi:hypothetical protein